MVARHLAVLYVVECCWTVVRIVTIQVKCHHDCNCYWFHEEVTMDLPNMMV
jgi:hypothetical protein